MIKNSNQRGVSTLEFTLSAAAFFLMLIMVIAGSVLFFTRSALVETTRRAARYAAMQPAANPAGTSRTTNGCDTTGPSLDAIKNVALYGNSAGTGSKLVSNLAAENICVEYSSFGVGTGSVSVSITNFNHSFQIPGLNQTIAMPPFRTTVNGESAGASPP